MTEARPPAAASINTGTQSFTRPLVGVVDICGRLISEMALSYSASVAMAILCMFHQFDAVAKRIIDIGATEAINRFVPNCRHARLFAPPDEFIQPIDE